MPASIYAALPTANFMIRLLKLQPSPDRCSAIHCSLISYSLATRRSGAHLFEALSYEWGSQDNQQTIFVHSGSALCHPLHVTRNLHAALIHLRDPLLERVLWIDAVCINQRDDDEKGHQVALMARIYGLAQRVVVWLGEEGDDSGLAFDDFNRSGISVDASDDNDTSISAEQGQSGDTLPEGGLQAGDDDAIRRQRAVVALLNRPYFRRIWVQQELAASRNLLFMCGDAECQGGTFREGRNLQRFNEQPMIERHPRTLRWLLRASSARPDVKGQPQLMLKPLGELINMFQTHCATDKRDKIFALLGMCSNTSSTHLLQPDYSIKWEELFSRLGKFTFGDRAVTVAHPEKEIQLVRTTGFILGRIGEVSSTDFWCVTQVIPIIAVDPKRYLDEENSWSIRCKVGLSAQAVKENDLVLLTEEKRKFVVVRPSRYFLRIILVTDSGLVRITNPDDSSSPDRPWGPFLKCVNTNPIQFNLTWIWNQDHASEQVELGLMNEYMLATTQQDQFQTFVRAPAVHALSDLSLVYESFNEYHLALNHLRDAASPKSGEEVSRALETIGAQKRLIVLEDKNRRRKLADDLITAAGQRYCGQYRALDLFLQQACRTIYRIMDRESPHIDIAYADRWEGPDWLGQASKSLSGGVSSLMLYKAASYKYFFKIFDALADESVQCSQEILEKLASRNTFSIEDFHLACKRIPGSITNLAAVLRKIKDARFFDNPRDNMARLLQGHGNRIVPTVDAIEAILELVPSVARSISVLLKAANPPFAISQTALSLAVSTLEEAPKTIRALIEADSSCCISEEVLMKVAQNQSSGPEVFKVLVELAAPRLAITEAVLTHMAKNKTHSLTFFEQLLHDYNPYLRIPPRILKEAIRTWKEQPMANVKIIRFLVYASNAFVQHIAQSSEIIVYLTVTGEVELLRYIHDRCAVPHVDALLTVAKHKNCTYHSDMSIWSRILDALAVLRADANELWAADIRTLGNAVLMWGAITPKLDIDRMLHAGLADANCRDEFDATPLLQTIICGSMEKLRVLLKHGAWKSSDVKTLKGFTPIDYLHMQIDQGSDQAGQMLAEIEAARHAAGETSPALMGTRQSEQDSEDDAIASEQEEGVDASDAVSHSPTTPEPRSTIPAKRKRSSLE